ncbi:MAG: hypothetical protein ACFFDK_02850 [Promethearchaeota archaeon]
MAKVIQDLWILTNGGIVLFNRVYDPKVSAQLFGALMTALDSYSREIGIGDGGLQNFEIKNIRFTIIRKNNLLFVANSSKRFKEKKVLNELDIISERFFSKYSDIFDDFENWNMEISVFSDFEEEIEDKLEDPVRQFWIGMAR